MSSMAIAGVFDPKTEESDQMADTMRPPAPKKKRSGGSKKKTKTKESKHKASAKKRASAGGKGVLAAKGVHLMVARVSSGLRDKLWRAARAKKASMNDFLTGLYEKAVS